MRMTRYTPTPSARDLVRARRWLSRLPWWLRWPLRLGWYGILAGLAVWIGVWLVYGSLARGFDLDKLGAMPERSIVYDSRGREMGRLHGENRIVVPLAAVSRYFIEALLVREDNRFYEHSGVDYYGLARALLRDLKDRNFTQGASTLTMQLARNSYKLEGKTLHRKLLEMALARRIERSRSKEEILELYVNRIFFGSGIYGVERAAQAYFGKPAKDLTLDEGAMLAAIIRGPNKFSPFRAPDIACSGRDMVLDRMVEKNRLSREQAEAAKKVVTKIQPEPAGTTQENYALDAVRRELARVLDAEDEEDGGLHIYTTIDMDLQEAAEKALEERLSALEKTKGYAHPTPAKWRERAAAGQAAEPDYLQGALVVFDNETGALRAVVGGRRYQDSPFNRALLASRPLGSTFKPFVYTAAVQAGLFPTTLVDDGPVTLDGWSPRNADRTFNGLRPAEEGLYRSRNTMTVRVGEMAGLDRVVELAERLGLGPVTQLTPQLYIGNHNASLYALGSACTTFPNAGHKMRPHVIHYMVNREGDVIFRNEPMSYPAMAPGAAWSVTKMMQKVFGKGGTAASARSQGYTAPAAGKTGTTDDFKDAWFVGFTKKLTCAVWVGLDQPQRISGSGSGSNLALPIWVKVMKAAAALGYPEEDPTPDVPVEKITLCSLSGKPATDGCRRADHAVTTEAPVDLLDHFATEPCPLHRDSPAPEKRRRRFAEETEGGSPLPSFWERLRRWFR